MTKLEDPILALDGITKTYAGTTALNQVDFACRSGEIHGILGENGAGKSTLIKVIAGVVAPDAGTIRLRGRLSRFSGPAEASALGITCMFQELSLIPDLTVADNICLQAPPRRYGLIDRKAQRRRAEELLHLVGCGDVNPAALVRDLSLSRRQMVEIAKALGQDPAVLILDEATSALTQRDVETVYDLLGNLRKKGVASLFISHRMQEVERLCDRLSVFRNGRHIETFARGEKSDAEIVRLMIGRDIVAKFPPKPAARPAEPLVSVRDLTWNDQLKHLDFDIRKGEILGVGGLDGQGQKELLLALFGVLKGASGDVTIGQVPGLPASPQAAKTGATRIALVPEDRKTEGLMQPLSIGQNVVVAAFEHVSTGGIIDRSRLAAAVEEGLSRLQVKYGALGDPVATLSGGNQQKVVLAKWLMIRPDLILLNDPTRGIDVGTKQEIFRIMRDLAGEGRSILFFSSDYSELIGVADRVMVMYDGALVRMLEGDALTEEAIISAALNMPQAVA